MPVCTVSQCDAIRSMTGNVTSSRKFLDAKCARNHPHKRDCLKLEIVMYLTHCGRVKQICVFTLQLCRTGEADVRFNTVKLGTSASSP